MLNASKISEMIGGVLVGDPDILVSSVAPLDEAQGNHVSFLRDIKITQKALESKAAVVVVPEDFAAPSVPGRAWVRVENPSQAFSILVEYFVPAPPVPAKGIHPSAVVADSAKIHPEASIASCVTIGDNVIIGEGSVVGAGCFLGSGTIIGKDCHIYPNAVIMERCILGDRVVIHSNAVIGSEGFGFERTETGLKRIPQRGIVQIDDDVEIGALTAVDRARFGKTWIKSGTKIDNLVQIAHNVEIGTNCIIISQVGVAGSTKIGKDVVLAGQSGVGDHLNVGDGTVLLATSALSKDSAPGSKLAGLPAIDRREFVANQGRVKRLPALFAEVKALREQIDELQKRMGKDN